MQGPLANQQGARGLRSGSLRSLWWAQLQLLPLQLRWQSCAPTCTTAARSARCASRQLTEDCMSLHLPCKVAGAHQNVQRTSMVMCAIAQEPYQCCPVRSCGLRPAGPIQISIFLTFCPVQCLLTPTRCHVDHSTTSACLLLPGPAALFKPSAVPFRTSAVAGSSASWQAQVLQDKGDKDTSHDRDSRMGTSGPVSGHSSLTMGAQATPFVPRSPFEDMRVGLVSASMLRSAPRCLTSSCT